MIDEMARTGFARVAAPVARVLGRAGVSPTIISWLGFALAVAAMVAVAHDRRTLAVAAWIGSRLADGLDGLVARETGQRSAFGGYLDITLDMAAYSGVVIAFGLRTPSAWLVCACVLAGYVLNITTTLALAAAAAEADRTLASGNRSLQFTRGLAEAGETHLVYALWLLFPASLVPVGWVWCVVILATVVHRSWRAWQVL
jgi:phosphatidylglycerophosphate synthase